MSEHDQRPPLGVAHVVLETDRMEESAHFMRTIGMRPIYQGPEVSVYELRGGTHLILMPACHPSALYVPGACPITDRSPASYRS